MDPRTALLDCLQRDPPATFEAALWLASEHDPQFHPASLHDELGNLAQRIGAALPQAPANELGQPLLRQLANLGFTEDQAPGPDSALLHRVLQRRSGQPLSLALIALEIARRLEIPLQGVDFPGHFLLRMAGADHVLDPATGRRLYSPECRELLLRILGPRASLSGHHLQSATPRGMLLRLSRNLRRLHREAGLPLAALKDAERVLELGEPTSADHLARAELYHELECPQGERFDLQRALLLSEDAGVRLRLTERLQRLQDAPAAH